MEALLYFGLWAVFIFLMMRFGCGAHIMGGSRGNRQARYEMGNDGNSELRWVPPKKARDPVCGRTVSTDTARPSVYAGDVFYFCSRECREAFEAAPDHYVEGDAPRRPGLERSHA